MQASQRLDRFGAEVFASLNNKLLALKAQGKTIYNRYRQDSFAN